MSSIILRLLFLATISLAADESEDDTFVLLGVSGTLQEGFELRHRLNYYEFNDPDAVDFATRSVSARFVGKGLVRGYKAYLDIKHPGDREYEADPYQPRVPNPVIIPTGCYHDANIYWFYLVYSRLVLHILAGEPRFLAITPDTGLVDLTASETSENVRRLALSQIEKHGYSNTTTFAVPLVTGVFFNPESFVESPSVYVKEDGTRVTSFEDSLAEWAGVKARDLLAEEYHLAVQRNEAWDIVYDKIRKTERETLHTSHPYMCYDEGTTRFGVSTDILRFPEVTTKDIYLAELAPDPRDEL